MKRYIVSIPIAGFAHVEVEANTREEAVKLAFEESEDPEVEWEYFEQLTRGNVNFASRYNNVVVDVLHEIDE